MASSQAAGTERRRTVLFLLALSLAELPFVAQVVSRRLIEPPASTLAAVAASFGPKLSLHPVQLRHRNYFVGLLKTSPLAWVPRFASGPPCYVFDDQGTLVGWSASTGDGELGELVHLAGLAPELSHDEVRRRIEQTP